MLAERIARDFKEWLCGTEWQCEWSLQGAFMWWLQTEAIDRTAGSYELYLRTVAIIISMWGTYPEDFTYILSGQEGTRLTELRGDETEDDDEWVCLQRDIYERALFAWQQNRPTRFIHYEAFRYPIKEPGTN